MEQLIEGENFHNVWARAVQTVIRTGTDITIGDETEPKPIRDINAMIVLTGNAIRQILNRELHPQFTFRFIDEYCREYTHEYQTEYLNTDKRSRFTYTYYDRLTYRHGIDQMVALSNGLRDQLRTGISSNRNQAITWIPAMDAYHNAAPCLQRIWIRHNGDRKVDIHLDWRSRDLYSAWQVNVIAVIDMLNRDVVQPNNCTISKIVDYSDSLHIYDSDKTAAEKVKPIPINPMENR